MKRSAQAETRSTVKARPFMLTVLLAAVVAAMAWRITQGADFTDESYYANFVYDWLKGSVRSSTLMTLHETAALVVFPAAKAYAAIMHGDTGLFLFLRALFLMGNVAAGLCWLGFLTRAGFGALAWAVAATAIAFIPFGLPAPSYNTLGLQGLEIGLAAFGAARLSSGRRAWAWDAVSAAGWAIATVAYPTLLAVLLVFLASSLVVRRPSGRVSYIALLLGAQAIGWGLVLAALGWRQLHASYAFLAEGNTVTDWPRKIRFTVDQLVQHPTFASECILAAALGLFGRQVGALLASAGVVAMALATLVLPPALFAPSHDLVLLLALSGLHLLGGLRPSARPAERLLAVLYLAALCAGLVTTATAYNSLYNFAVGGAAAALLALLGPRSDWRPGALALTARAAVMATLFLALALTHLYGGRPGPPGPRQRIGEGVFAGLWLEPGKAAMLKLVRDHLTPLADRPGATVAEIGIYPGLIMETGARPLMLAVYPVIPTSPAPVRAKIARFHQARPADWVMVYHDVTFEPYNPFGDSLASRYRLVRRDQLAWGSLELFQRRQPGL